jgi:hypothetical protein
MINAKNHLHGGKFMNHKFLCCFCGLTNSKDCWVINWDRKGIMHYMYMHKHVMFSIGHKFFGNVCEHL